MPISRVPRCGTPVLPSSVSDSELSDSDRSHTNSRRGLSSTSVCAPWLLVEGGSLANQCCSNHAKLFLLFAWAATCVHGRHMPSCLNSLSHFMHELYKRIVFSCSPRPAPAPTIHPLLSAGCPWFCQISSPAGDCSGCCVSNSFRPAASRFSAGSALSCVPYKQTLIFGFRSVISIRGRTLLLTKRAKCIYTMPVWAHPRGVSILL